MDRQDGKIIERNIEAEMKTAYIDYAMSVIVSRALPDARDGLKPVHRRILYSMHEDGITSDKPYRKCANTVGSVLGRYHPHGDASVYDAMVRMAQDFSMRYMLIDGHGNFGSIDGDPPAAYRYTEARMSKIAVNMLADIEKDTVDFMPNFDDRLQEPVVLPAKIPALLANGSSGIAVGMATNIPPHNLGELIDGIVKIIDEDEVTDEDLMTVIKGPDFPTGATILGREGIKQAYTTGRGKITLRAETEIEEMSGNRQRIIVSSLPYQVNKAKLIEHIAELVKGAADMEKMTSSEVAFNDNIAAVYAAARNALYRTGKKIEILVNFQPKLHYFAEWWKQLYGESEGKDNKGIYPSSVDFSTDLHSMGQWIQEGERTIFETVLSIDKVQHSVLVPSDEENLDGLNFLAGKHVDEVNKMAELGTQLAHVDGGVPNIRITIPELKEYWLGQLIYFFEKACGISGYMLQVNPFNQPGVEAYKKNMFALLNKPGYEAESKAILERIKK